MRVEFSALADEKLQHLLLFLQENWPKSVQVNFFGTVEIIDCRFG